MKKTANLPNECIEDIFRHLTGSDLLTCSLVCPDWNEFIGSTKSCMEIDHSLSSASEADFAVVRPKVRKNVSPPNLNLPKVFNVNQLPSASKLTFTNADRSKKYKTCLSVCNLKST